MAERVGRVSSQAVSCGRGRRAAVDFVVCFGWGGFFLFFFFSSNAHGLACCTYEPPLLHFSSLLVLRQGRESEATEAVFAYRRKKPLHTGVLIIQGTIF